MKFLRFTWKLFVMAAVFGVGYIVGREHSFEEEEQWEAENKKNSEHSGAFDKAEGSGSSDECKSCSDKACDSCDKSDKADENKADEKGVVFEYKDEKAVKVALVGTFNNWNKDADPMTKENDTWKCTKKLVAGTYEYQYVVNDTDWVVDEKAGKIVKNKYEGKNAVIEVK